MRDNPRFPHYLASLEFLIAGIIVEVIFIAAAAAESDAQSLTDLLTSIIQRVGDGIDQNHLPQILVSRNPLVTLDMVDILSLSHLFTFLFNCIF